jgi:hypothetical protein
MSGATQNADGSRKPWKHGATISKDGEVRLTSVSALELHGRCPRRWKFAYGPEKLKDPPSKSQERGNQGHHELAVYMTTGSRAHLSSLTIGGLHQVPAPEPTSDPARALYVELDLVPDLPDGKSGLQQAKLRAGGIPVAGALDLMHWRTENCGVTDIMDMRDEPGVLKLTDWKFPGDLKNAKSGPELVDTLQMAGYGKWAFEVYPGLERVRLSHGYFPQRGRPIIMTTVADREQIEQTWKRADAIAVSMRHAAREPDTNKVDANTRDCHAFNRPCPALVAGKCSAPGDKVLEEFVGITTAERLIEATQLVRHRGDQQMTQPAAPNSIFAHFQQQAAPAPAPVQMNPYSQMPFPPPAPAPAPAPPVVAPDVQAEMARLAAQTAAANHAVITAPINFDVRDVVQQIIAFGFGLPKLTGLAAGYVGKVFNIVPRPEGVDHVIDGNGELAHYTVNDVTILPQILENCRKEAALRAGAGVPAPMPIQSNVASPLPPDAPAMAAPVQAPSALPAAPAGPTPEELKAQKEADKAAKKAAKEAEKAAKKAAEELAKQGAAAAAVNVPPASVQAPVTTSAVASMPVPAPTPTPAEPVKTAPSNSTINFYVDCAIDGLQTMSLHPHIETIKRELTRDSGLPDFRMAEGDSKYAFGKWEGMFCDLLRRSGIPAGNYSYDSSYTRIGALVIETMRELVRESGGVFVKGAR